MTRSSPTPCLEDPPEVAAAPEPDGQAGWALFQRFVLRRAGFAFDRMGGLALTTSAPALDAAVQATTRLQAAIDDWNRERFPMALEEWRRSRDTAAKCALERVARAVKRGQAPVAQDADAAAPLLPGMADWVASFRSCVDRLQAAELAYRAAFAQDFQACRSALSALADSDDFREAVLLLAGSAPALSMHSDSPRNSAVRQREQLLFKYAQRFCAKNETNSFFGPVHYGDVAAAPRALELAYDWDRRPVQRRAFFSHWAIDELAAAVAHDTRLKSLVDICGGPACLQVAPDQVDAAQALSALLARLQPRCEEEALALSEWLDALGRLRQTAQSFAQEPSLPHKAALAASLESRFQALGGSAVRRHAGQMFRTRGLVYEDAWVDASVGMPSAMAHSLERALGPLLDIALLYSRLWRARVLARCRAVAQAWFGGADRIPYDRFIVAWHEQHRQARALDPALLDRVQMLDQRIRDFESEWTHTLDTAPEGRLDSLHPARFAGYCEGLPLERWAVVSPDLLPMRQAGGDVHWVLGEIHHGVTMDGWMLSFAPDQEQCKAAIDRVVAQGLVGSGAGARYLPANLTMARRMKTAPPLYPGLTVALSAHATPRPAQADGIAQHALAVRELELQLDGGEGLRLVQAGSSIPVRFHPPAFGFDADGYAPFEACSLPVLRLPRRVGNGYAQRCTVDQLVVARAEWRIDATVLPPRKARVDDAVLELNRWRTSLGMPRHVFLKSSDEPKPVYVDWLSPHVVEYVLHLARRGGRWVISEMLPGPDELWLRGGTGRYTSECRFLMTMVTS
jgi:hypothetical protein